VNAGVRPAGDGQRDRRAPEDLPDPFLCDRLDGPEPGLPGPSGKTGPLIGNCDLEDGYTSSRKTISVESDRRGPSFTMRV
jgi:hypothetical protein